jgi:hypothetical protein
MKNVGYWTIDFKIVVNNNEVSFDELSDSSREDIIEKIRDGYTGGEIDEEMLEQGQEVFTPLATYRKEV